MTEYEDSRHAQMTALFQRQIIDILKNNGIPTNPSDQVGFTKWTVETDLSVRRYNEGKEWCAIEIKTPAYYFHSWDLEQIEKVVNLVNSNFDTYTNPSCGLQVHVGNLHNGFLMRTLKNFCMLITTLERQFDSLHPAHRIDNYYVQIVGEQFSGVDPRNKIQAIELYHTPEDVVYGLNANNNKLRAYNFTPLLSAFRTIELRQHSGSMDPAVIVHWAKIASSLLRVSYSSSYSGFLGFIEDDINDEHYSVIDLLNDLKFDE